MSTFCNPLHDLKVEMHSTLADFGFMFKITELPRLLIATNMHIQYQQDLQKKLCTTKQHVQNYC